MMRGAHDARAASKERLAQSIVDRITGLPWRLAEQRVEGARGLAVHGRRRVTVEVEGDRHRRVAEHLRDEFRMDTLAEHERRRGVSCVVGSDDGNASAFEEPMPAVVDRLHGEGAPIKRVSVGFR
jgi:hypothetical protein